MRALPILALAVSRLAERYESWPLVSHREPKAASGSDVAAVALGSRLRRLAALFKRDAALVYRLYEVPLDPRWFPVCAMLAERDSMPVLALAEAIGHSHAAVSQVVRRLVGADLAVVANSAEDAGVSQVSLTEKGKAAMEQMAPQRRDVEAVVRDLFEQKAPDFWKSLDELESALADGGMELAKMAVADCRWVWNLIRSACSLRVVMQRFS